jgi:hypothetical protein
MIRSFHIALASLAISGLSFFGGCSKQPATTQGGAASAAPGSTAVAAPNTEAITNAASVFMDAVLKGDTQRASACLTPQALKRIVESGKQFAPPGLETASFKIGEVRTPSVDKAFVHCILTDTSSGLPHSEEMCCLMRQVAGEWRVSGIAYWDGMNTGGTMSDFETGQSTPIPGSRPQIPMAGQTAPPAGVPATQGQPPHMAQEPGQTAPR